MITIFYTRYSKIRFSPILIKKTDFNKILADILFSNREGTDT